MAEENKTTCPICGKNFLKIGTGKDRKTPNRIYCSGYKFDPNAGGSIGECDFTFWLTDSKKGAFGKVLTAQEAKKLITGEIEKIVSPYKHEMRFDKDAPEKGFKDITWAEKNDAFL